MSPVRRMVSLVGVVSVWLVSSMATAQPAREVGAIGRGSGSAGNGAAVGRRPVADAGRDRTAAVGATVRLDGAGSTDADGDRLLYRWVIVRRPAASQASLSGATTLAPTFTVDVPGRYVVRLAVSDGRFVSEADDVVVDTRNSAPVADAGLGQTLAVGATARLSGASSTDVDGDALTYTWALESMPHSSHARLSDAASVSPTFEVDRPGRYVARLVVDDGRVQSQPVRVAIDTQNSPPVSVAGAAGPAVVGEVVHLDGTGSTDVDGDLLTYRWMLIARPAGSAATLSDATAVSPSFVADRPGPYVAQLVTRDAESEGTAATVLVSTGNTAPVARVAPTRSVAPGQVAVLDGSASTDPDGDPLSYRWALVAKPAGSTATLSDTATATPNFVVDRPGLYVAQLVVNDGVADSLPVTTPLPTMLGSPVAVPAASRTGTTVQLDGGASYDPDGDPIAYTWALIAKPAGSAAAISNPALVNPTFTIDVAGTYVAQLIVSDASASSAAATVGVAFSTLYADAGPDQSLGAVGVQVQLAGQGSTGTTTYSWSFVTKPAGSAAVLSDATVAAPSFIADVAGDYVLQLVVGDGTFQSEPDTVVVRTNLLRLVITPNRLTLAPGGTGTLTVTMPTILGAPGLSRTITLLSTDAAAAAVPVSVTIPEGLPSATFTVTAGPGAGGAIITASAPGVASGRAVVGVGVNVVEWAVDADGTWDTAANWSGGSVPAAGDVVLIDRPAGHYTVSILQPTAGIRALLADEAVVVNNTLSVAQDATFAGGLSLAATLNAGRVSLAGLGTWSAGLITGGPFDVLPGATLAVTTTNQKVLLAPLTNHGTVMWTGGEFYLQNVAVTNASGATWEAQAASVLALTSTSCGSPTFTNAGLIRKTGAGLLQVASCVALTNTGTIELQGGSLSGTMTTSGLLTGVSGTTFELANVTLAAGSTFGGAALLYFNGNTTVTGDVVTTLPALVVGSVTGSGKLTLGAATTWQSGVVTLAGGLEVQAGQTLTLSTGNQKVLGAGPLTNHGTVVWTGGEFYLQNVAVTNASGATWEAQGALTVTSSNCGAPSFANDGLLRMAGATSTLTVASCVAFGNTGTIQLRLAGTGAGQYDRISAGTATLGGTLDVQPIGGFVPAPGDSFGVFSYSTLSGAFATVNGNGHSYGTTYAPSLLTIQKQ